ncbi:hypothetical protein ACHHYP_13121 [Achlya hypogyna]|uniref:Myb-like DNA-binding protein n=1 Tax=Achlya hypogyna TaxID=1202772 RepID=A0A1V9YFU3_ACHHY|nr:hypothetical protein ACHHYP_13121 [Achlya hypogyna]
MFADKSEMEEPTWSAHEDQVLRDAVFKHGGKQWRGIAEKFATKTPKDCQMRWHRLQNRSSSTKRPWTKDEDARMVDLIHRYGPRKWAVIASYLPGRNGKQCRERWHNQLNPAIKRDAWAKEEEELLLHMQAKYGNCWAKIAARMPGRCAPCEMKATHVCNSTDNSIKNHWYSSIQPKMKRAPPQPASPKPQKSKPAAPTQHVKHVISSPAVPTGNQAPAPPPLAEPEHDMLLDCEPPDPDKLFKGYSALTPTSGKRLEISLESPVSAEAHALHLPDPLLFADFDVRQDPMDEALDYWDIVHCWEMELLEFIPIDCDATPAPPLVDPEIEWLYDPRFV